jgi:hypothetical protein
MWVWNWEVITTPVQEEINRFAARALGGAFGILFSPVL